MINDLLGIYRLIEAGVQCSLAGSMPSLSTLILIDNEAVPLSICSRPLSGPHGSRILNSTYLRFG